jgi:plasmid stabilization system protein ParE
MAHRVAPRAEADLDDIWLYVAKESASMDVATRLIDSITGRLSFLAAFPYVGRVRDEDFGTGTRSFVVGEYIIVYCVNGPDVLILRWYTVDAILKPYSISGQTLPPARNSQSPII